MSDAIKEAVKVLEKIAATNGPSQPPKPDMLGGGGAGEPIPMTNDQKIAIAALETIRAMLSVRDK